MHCGQGNEFDLIVYQSSANRYMITCNSKLEYTCQYHNLQQVHASLLARWAYTGEHPYQVWTSYDGNLENYGPLKFSL